jgi:hypothetical protein
VHEASDGQFVQARVDLAPELPLQHVDAGRPGGEQVPVEALLLKAEAGDPVWHVVSFPDDGAAVSSAHA